MNVFRALSVALSEQEQALALLDIEKQDFLLEQVKLEFLQDIKKYILDFEWLTQQRTKERIKYYLVHHCDIRKTATYYHVTTNTIQVAVSYAANKLKNTVTPAIIKSILSSTIPEEIEELMINFYTQTGMVQMERLFVKGVTTYLSQPKEHSNLSLEDCRNELVFLATMSTMNFKVLIQKYDQEKLAYILNILQQSNFSIEKNKLLSLFNGELADIDGKTLSIKEQVQQTLASLANN